MSLLITSAITVKTNTKLPFNGLQKVGAIPFFPPLSLLGWSMCGVVVRLLLVVVGV